MNIPVKFNPKSQLQSVDVHHGKLVGYRRLAPNPPATLLPVFVDASDSQGSLLLYQRIDDSGNVSSFLGDPDLKSEHLIRKIIGEEENLKVRTGEKAIQAYEVDSTEIIVAQSERFKKLLKDLLKDKELSGTPFAALELARFVEDSELETAFAKECANDLARRSQRLAVCWASAARLSVSARRAAMDAVVAPIDPRPRKVAGKRLSKKSPAEIWADVKMRIRDEIGEDIFRSWFGRMDIKRLYKKTVHLTVPTRFLRTWIQTHYIELLLGGWKSQMPAIERISLSVRSAAARPPAARVQSPALSRSSRDYQIFGLGDEGQPANVPFMTEREALGGSPLNPRFAFETFIIGRSNALAHAAAKQVATSRRGEQLMFNPLYIHGDIGFGKTHLLQAISRASSNTDRKVLYLTAERFMYGFVSALKTQTTRAFNEALRTIDVLMIDDLQFLQGRSTQAQFLDTLNALIVADRQVVIASDRPPSDLESLDDRVRSRLAGGLVVEIGSLGEEMRLEILKSQVATVRLYHPDFEVPASVLVFIAKSVARNGRDLEGAVNRLLAHNKLTSEPVTIEVAEREIRDLIRPVERQRVRIENIQRIVARQYNVSRADLLSSRRTANVIRPRQVAMYLAKILTLRSLPEIGRRFGGRDHTTVLHAVRKIEALAAIDTAFAEELEQLKGQLSD
jgi:chromosomal replication initiator protein